MAGGRFWTEEEDLYLEENVGKYKLSTIAKKLGRTTGAVVGRLERLGLSNTKLQTGRITANELATALKVDSHVPLKWIREKGLPCMTRVTGISAAFHFIDVESFWEWAEKNKEMLNFSKIDKHTLLPQPEWVEDQRRIDAYRIPKKAHANWTPVEDELVITMVKNRQNMSAIAERLKRSEKAVQRKVSRLRAEGRLPFKRVVIPWRADEINLMVELEKRGMTDVEIAAELGREHFHISDKRRRLKRESWYVGKNCL